MSLELGHLLNVSYKEPFHRNLRTNTLKQERVCFILTLSVIFNHKDVR